MEKFRSLRIAIFCPIGYVTGGPEALHQLCDALRSFGHEARLVPTIVYGPPSKEYCVYDAPVSDISFAHNADFIITPETHLKLDQSLINFPRNRIYIWWLSVDNSSAKLANRYELRNHPVNMVSFMSLKEAIKFRKTRIKIHLQNLFTKVGFKGIAEQKEKEFDLSPYSHIAQSFYARAFLDREIGLKVPLVSDYIQRYEVTQKSVEFRTSKKIVCYNFAKSHLQITKLITKMASSVQFIPLTGMDGYQIRNYLSVADLYLDLGSFPGRDRMPREAILAGCPVLIAKRGAARFYGDFKLDDEFKFDLTSGTYRELESVVKSFLNDKSALLTRQSEFASQVRQDKITFEKEVKSFLNILMDQKLI